MGDRALKIKYLYWDFKIPRFLNAAVISDFEIWQDFPSFMQILIASDSSGYVTVHHSLGVFAFTEVLPTFLPLARG